MSGIWDYSHTGAVPLLLHPTVGRENRPLCAARKHEDFKKVKLQGKKEHCQRSDPDSQRLAPPLENRDLAPRNHP